MANDLNKWQGIGRLGNDPEIRYLPSGSAVANLSIACGSSWKNKNTGQKKEETEWVNIVAFGRLGEIIGEYLKKGSQVYIEGRLKTEKYEKDGQTRYSTKVIAENMQMLGSKENASAIHDKHSSSDNRQPAHASLPPQQPGGHSAPDFDDEIPW